MFRGSAARFAAATMAATVVAGTALVLGGTVANAAPSKASAATAKYTCQIPVLGKTVVTTKLTLSVPAKVKSGETIKIGTLLVPSGLPSATITDVTVKWTLTESGAKKGTVNLSASFASGNAGSLKVDLTGKLKLPKSGTVKLTAGKVMTFSVTNSVLGKAKLTCTASSKLPVLGSITVGKSGMAAAVAEVR